MICRHVKIFSLIAVFLVVPPSYALTSKIRFTSVCEPLTTLNINGKKVRRLLIDTGATGGIHLKENVINSLPGNPAKYVKNDRYTDAFGIIRQAKYYIAPQLVINGVHMNNVPLTTFNLWGNQEERQHIEPLNGVIGLDTFGDNTLLIDVQKMTIEVAASFELDEQGQWEELPIKRTDYGIELYATGDAGKRLRLVLDTGTNHNVLFAKDSESNASNITEVVAGKSQVIRVIRGVFNALEMTNGGIDGFIGCDYFKGKRLIIAKNNIYISSH